MTKNIEYDPDEDSVQIVCDFCPYCGRKKVIGPVLLVVYPKDQTSIVFHKGGFDLNDTCEVPASML